MKKKHWIVQTVKRWIMNTWLLTALGPAAVLSFSLNASATDGEQLLTKIGSNHPSIRGKPVWVSAITNSNGLTAIKYPKGNIPLQRITEQGAPLFKISLLGHEINIVKIKRGWPVDLQSTDENPEIHTDTSHLDSSGGKVTLSYILDMGLIGASTYRHLPLELVRSPDGQFKLVTSKGQTASFLYANSQQNERGLKSIEPVSPSKFAHLTGDILVTQAPAVSARTEKRELGSGENAQAKDGNNSAAELAK